MFILAYIDPSSMTYLIQIIAGVVIAAGAGIGFYWKRIRRHMRKKQEESLEESGQVPGDLSQGETITAEMLNTDTPEQK